MRERVDQRFPLRIHLSALAVRCTVGEEVYKHDQISHPLLADTAHGVQGETEERESDVAGEQGHQEKDLGAVRHPGRPESIRGRKQ